MYSKFIKLIVLVSLLVCCGFAGRVLYGHLSQECRTRGRSTSQPVFNFSKKFRKSPSKFTSRNTVKSHVGGKKVCDQAYGSFTIVRHVFLEENSSTDGKSSFPQKN